MSLLLVAWHGHTGLAEKLSNFTYLWVPRVCAFYVLKILNKIHETFNNQSFPH